MNNKEKFLLKLLDSADVVTADSEDEDFFVFKPKDINFELRIPYSGSSNAVNINFVLSSTYNTEHKTSLSFSSIDEIPTFMATLYEKYAEYFNSYKYKHYKKIPTFPQEAIDKIEVMLKSPIDSSDYPYFLSGKDASLIIRDNEAPHGIQIDLGRAIYHYDGPISLNPLSFVFVECSFKDEKTSFINKYHKIIPAFLIKQYPVISNILNVNESSDNLHVLIDTLKQLDNGSANVLSAMMLELELDDNNSSKKRHKI